MRKLTQERVIERIRAVHGDSYDLSKLNYINKRTKVIVGCKNHSPTLYFETRFEQLLRGQGCFKCGQIKAAKSRRISFSDFIKQAEKNHSEEYWKRYTVDKSTYTFSVEKIKVYCSEHDISWDIVANAFKMGQGCRACSFEKTAMAKRLPLTEILERAKVLHGNKYDYSKTKQPDNQNDEIIVFCPKHGEFESIVGNHINPYIRSGCPTCNASRGEKKLSIYFKSKGISYETQKTFVGLKSEGNLKCDFYLLDFNIVIEYNGRQHYEPVKAFGGEKEYKKIVKRDKIKKKYCLDNGIRFEVIKYDEDIDERLGSILN